MNEIDALDGNRVKTASATLRKALAHVFGLNEEGRPTEWRGFDIRPQSSEDYIEPERTGRCNRQTLTYKGRRCREPLGACRYHPAPFPTPPDRAGG